MPEFEILGRGLKKLFGSRNDRLLKSLAPIVGRVNALEPEYEKLTDARLRAKTAEFRQRLEKGETLDQLLPEAFAACRESSKRTLGMRHFDVQILGGLVLHQGKIAEMATGEGKTLVATLPSYLNALSRKGVHVVTVNDYLAKRDAKWMSPAFEALDMRIGVIQSQMPPSYRLPAYRSDVTYGTNSEFGFDYLRDNMKLRLEDQTQQGKHNFAIVDEVDSILIDEARTPLIIAGSAEESTERYYVADRAVKQLKEGAHFEVNEKDHHVVLSEEGIEQAQQLVGVGSFYDPANIDWPHHVDQALKANYLYRRDREYVVDEGEEGPEIVIVDEFTGRKMSGRRWSDGLHQAVEAKEGLRIREENQTLATITYQNFFRLYDKLAGMTGTALTEASEFLKIYKLDVVVMPTNRRLRRSKTEDFIFRTRPEKLKAIAEEIAKVNAQGRPILVGTTSVEKSEELASLLQGRTLRQSMTNAPAAPTGEPANDEERKEREADRKKWDEPLVPAPIGHELLNAKHHEREAGIIARAGQAGAVTIATNMAGRGTDIILGPGVAEKGGLHVVGTERHEARRIDNQLRGRAGRQGDPGSSQFFLSLEDDLMRIFAKDWVGAMLQKLGMEEGQEIQSPMVSRMIERVQKKMEAHNFDIRKNLLEYDAVNNDQRKVVYGWRQAILEGRDQQDRVAWAVEEVTKRLAAQHLERESPDAEPDLAGLAKRFRQLFGDEMPPQEELAPLSPAEGAKVLAEKALRVYRERSTKIGDERMRALERYILLQTIDDKWKDHLHALDYLRTGVGMRGYGQEDPKIVYRREAHGYFEQMVGVIQESICELLFHVQPQSFDRGAGDGGPEGRDDGGDESAGGARGAAPQAPPDGFDEDEWGPDDDDTDWDAVGRGEVPDLAIGTSPQPAAGAMPQPTASLLIDEDDGGGGSMLATASTTTASAPSRGTPHRRPAAKPAPPRPALRDRPVGDPLFTRRDVQPNDPCPCGSGRKYKKCHGG